MRIDSSTQSRRRTHHRGSSSRSFSGGFFLIYVFFAFNGVGVAGDHIVLKNGNVIEAESTWDDANSIHYLRNGGEYAISKVAVLRLERTRGTQPRTLPLVPGSGVIQNPTASSAAEPMKPGNQKSIEEWVLSIVPNVASSMASTDDLEGKFSSLESQLRRNPNDDVLRSEWLNAASAMLSDRISKNDLRGAAAVLKRSLNTSPREFSLLLHWGAVSLRLNDFLVAEEALSSALVLSPQSLEARELIGLAEYLLGRNEKAIEHWETALKISPQAVVAGLLAKAKREQTVEKDFGTQTSAHFKISSNGVIRESELSRSILAELENDFSDLSSIFLITPAQAIPVVLYTDQEFQQATNLPHFINGMNDGKVRVPVQGLSQMTAPLSALLRHELAHSFIQQKSQGSAPRWLHEGMAQSFASPGSCNKHNPWWQKLKDGDRNSLSLLDQSLTAAGSDAEATHAYKESLSLVCFIENTYGSDSLQQLLSEAARQGSFEAAIKSVFHEDVDGFENEWKHYLDVASRI